MIVTPGRQDRIRERAQITMRRENLALYPCQQRRERLAARLAPFDTQIKPGQGFLARADAFKRLGPFHPQQRTNQRRRIVLLEQVASEDAAHRVQ